MHPTTKESPACTSRLNSIGPHRYAIALGGNGIAVVSTRPGCTPSSLFSYQVKADRLLLLADVPAVMTNFDMPDAEPL